MGENNIYGIIVTFNPDITLLFKQFSALMDQITSIIYIDNGSNNIKEISDFIEYILPCNKVIFICNRKNMGIGYAQNVGIKLAKIAKCSHVILFDQDTYVPENIVEVLLNEESILLLKGINVGAIGPIHFDSRTSLKYPLARIQGILLKKVFPDTLDESSLEVSYIIASGSMIRISVFDEIGLMDEQLFIDMVDIEWCLRASHWGYKIFATQSISLPHSIGDERKHSFSKEISVHSELRRYYMIRNRFLLLHSPYIPFGYKARLIMSIPFGLFQFLVAVRFKMSYLRLIVLGIIHGITNKGGRIDE